MVQLATPRTAVEHPVEEIADTEEYHVQHSLTLATGKTWPSTVSGDDPVPRPNLRTDTDKLRMFGQSHWTHAFEQVS